MRLRGWVYRKDGSPIIGAVVRVYEYGSTSPIVTTLTGTNGEWSVSGLPKDPLRIQIQHEGEVRWIDGGSEVVLAAAHIEYLSAENLSFPDNSLPGTVIALGSLPGDRLADGSVPATALSEGAGGLHWIQVENQVVEFGPGEGLLLEEGFGVSLDLSSGAHNKLRIDLAVDGEGVWEKLVIEGPWIL